MKTVIVKKDELLEKLEANRSQHKAIFDEATKGYGEEAVKLLEKHLADVKAGKIKMVQVYLPVPENHMKDYDRVITMVKMSVDNEIELDETRFSQYVMDEWSWKRAFLASNSGYSATATRMMEDDTDD